MTASAISDTPRGARPPRPRSLQRKLERPPYWPSPLLAACGLAACCLAACGGAQRPAVTPVEAAEEVAEALGDAAPYEAPADVPDGAGSTAGAGVSKEDAAKNDAAKGTKNPTAP